MTTKSDSVGLTVEEATEHAGKLLNARISEARIREALQSKTLTGSNLGGNLGWRTNAHNVAEWVSKLLSGEIPGGRDADG